MLRLELFFVVKFQFTVELEKSKNNGMKKDTSYNLHVFGDLQNMVLNRHPM